MRLVTHPVLAELRDNHHRAIFVHLINDEEAKSDILRHCLGSQTFKNVVLRLGEDEITDQLSEFYIGVWCNHHTALRVRDPVKKKRAEDRAITALFLAETCFSETVYAEQDNGYIMSFSRGTLENPIPYFLPAQLNYIMRGEIVSGVDEHVGMLQHNVEHNMVETIWQNADPVRVLDNLDRLRGLGLTIPDSVAFRLFTDTNMRTVADRLVAIYIARGETVLSESFLRRLESSSLATGRVVNRPMPNGVSLDIIGSAGEPLIPGDRLRKGFLWSRKNRRVQQNAQIAQNMFQWAPNEVNLGNQNAGGQGQGHANQ
jgi:hypothetical protein